MTNNEKIFAWQGISFKIPKDWDLNTFSGDYKEGYLRLDNPEKICLELRWRREKRQIATDSILKNYISNLEKKAKKQKINLENIKPDKEFIKTRLKDKEANFFAWKIISSGTQNNSSKMLGFVSQCNRCHTILMAQFFFNEDESPIVSEILKSLEDHPVSAYTQWALFDFSFSIPSEFNLDKCSLKSGYLEFIFSNADSNIKIKRWGLAEMLLREKTINEWSRAIAPSTLRSLILNAEVKRSKDHQSTEVTLQRWKWQAFYARRCETENKLFALEYSGKKNEKMFAEICSRIKCG